MFHLLYIRFFFFWLRCHFPEPNSVVDTGAFHFFFGCIFPCHIFCHKKCDIPPLTWRFLFHTTIVPFFFFSSLAPIWIPCGIHKGLQHTATHCNTELVSALVILFPVFCSIMNPLGLWIHYDCESLRLWIHYDYESLVIMNPLWLWIPLVSLWIPRGRDVFERVVDMCVCVATSASFFPTVPSTQVLQSFCCCIFPLLLGVIVNPCGPWHLGTPAQLRRWHRYVSHCVSHFSPHYIFSPVWYHWYQYRSLGTVTSFSSSTAASSTWMCVTFFVPLHYISSIMSFLVHDVIFGSCCHFWRHQSQSDRVADTCVCVAYSLVSFCLIPLGKFFLYDAFFGSIWANLSHHRVADMSVCVACIFFFPPRKFFPVWCQVFSENRAVWPFFARLFSKKCLEWCAVCVVPVYGVASVSRND